MTKEERQRYEAMDRLNEAFSVFNDILAEVEKGKLHPVDGLQQMMAEFMPDERRKWGKVFKERTFGMMICIKCPTCNERNYGPKEELKKCLVCNTSFKEE